MLLQPSTMPCLLKQMSMACTLINRPLEMGSKIHFKREICSLRHHLGRDSQTKFSLNKYVIEVRHKQQECIPHNWELLRQEITHLVSKAKTHLTGQEVKEP